MGQSWPFRGGHHWRKKTETSLITVDNVPSHIQLELKWQKIDWPDHHSCVLITMFHPRWLDVITSAEGTRCLYQNGEPVCFATSLQVRTPIAICWKWLTAPTTTSPLISLYTPHQIRGYNYKNVPADVYCCNAMALVYENHKKHKTRNLTECIFFWHWRRWPLKPHKYFLVVGFNGVICDIKDIRQISRALQFHLLHHVLSRWRLHALWWQTSRDTRCKWP